MKSSLSIIASVAILLSSAAAKAQSDGPYIIYGDDGSARIISVDAEGAVHDDSFKGVGPGNVFTVTSDSGLYSFNVRLHKNVRPDWKYPASEKTFVMSDPHGNLECVISLLQGNGVINEDLEWSFGQNHLIILGDIADRGVDATQIYWLFYKLEAEAQRAGGHMSFIYGNHETMILAGDMRYTKDKYKNLAASVGMEFPAMMGPDTELGRWLATRNTIQIIGDDLFVHAGLSGEFLEKRMSIPEVNEVMSAGLFLTSAERKKDDLTYFMFKSYGPVWYRGLVHKKAKYNPASMDELDEVLAFYGVRRMFVGHTIFRNVKPFYRRKVIDVNVSNLENMEKGRSRAVLIEGGRTWRVGDEGPMRPLD